MEGSYTCDQEEISNKCAVITESPSRKPVADLSQVPPCNADLNVNVASTAAVSIGTYYDEATFDYYFNI